MKKHTIRVLGGVVLSLALAASTAACGTADTGGGEAGKCEGTIGFMGALSGGNASIVLPSFNGAKLALKQFLAKNKDCKVTLKEFDSEGDPAKAAPLATQIATDKKFIGVIGGAFSGETEGTKKTFEEAGVTMVSQSATATALTTENPVSNFHRVVGHDATQGAAIAIYATNTLEAKKLFVVDDGTTYGKPLADTVVEKAGKIVAGRDQVQEKQTNFSSTVSKVKSSKADAVVYLGYAREAGPFLKQLRAAGVTIPFLGGDGLYGADFPKAAGAQAEGAIITCPCLPGSEAAGSFKDDYEAEYGEAPGAYAAEGFDAMNIFLDAIKAGNTTRPKVEKFVDAYDKEGATKHLKFDDKGDVDESSVVVWSYVIEGGSLAPDEEIALK
ncbi:MAG: branched-chain amino acid ABC transporter substrate-binding protein [Micromonosporaceae bacterium]